MKESLEQIIKFFGYGDPESAKLFFMGIEEHDEFPDTDFFDSAKGDKYLYKVNPVNAKADGSTEQMQCKIYKKMFSNLNNEQIFKSEIHCFNYYPIGASSVGSIGANVSELLRFKPRTKLDIYDYFDHKTERATILKEFIKEKILKQDKLLIVFGKKIWDKTKELLRPIQFHPDSTDWTMSRGRPSPIQWSTDKKIWLTGHPSHGWITEKVVDYMVKIRALKD